ncbi:hypothetical protein AVEN_227595-1 [Araneus ventricosus]|uniref:Integrase catalytic domain-containing protein n=1 Tax=Araneus ventricosus TaxID=182803 RepID=A0A4Y2K9E8_ARAVE|nr:hypothetical protein AVEN_227595-1 [Araneus ventricosus]
MNESSDSSDGKTVSHSEVSRIAVKVPTFWRENRTIWFSQLESQFITSGIVQDSTKYHTVVASVETEILSQKSKIVRHVHSPLAEFKVPNQRFVHINIDIIGSLPSSQGFTYCLTAIDRFSRWSETMPLADIRAETVAQTLYSGWISRFGVSQRISTDRGSQFASDVFHSLAKTFGIRLSHTAAYHPQANGAIERWHRTLKAAIM